jgi:hypothetical protein
MSWTGREAEAGYRKLEGGLNIGVKRWKSGKAGKRNLEREKRGRKSRRAIDAVQRR